MVVWLLSNNKTMKLSNHCRHSSVVEHFHGKEGVRGSSPRVGSSEYCSFTTAPYSGIVIYMNTKERGDLALGTTIHYYMTQGFEVCLPIGDKRAYDLIVEKEGLVSRVQVKYAGLYPAKNKCYVGLRITGGNQSYHYARKYDEKAFDTLFVYTERGKRYSIPWSEVTARSEISIENAKYQKYEV
jgi:hypothetical protein